MYALHAMVDPLHTQNVECGFDVCRWSLLAGMCHDVQAEFAASRKHARKFLWRMADFAGIEPNADEVIAKRQGRFQSGKGICFG